MKTQLSAIALLACACLAGRAQAQNIPVPYYAPVPGNVSTPAPADYSSGGNTAPSALNFTRVWVADEPTTQVNTTLAGTGIPFRVSTTYTNGWGQPIQSIRRAAAGQVADLITTYDNRTQLTSASYLPYSVPYESQFQQSPYTDQKNFYQNKYPDEGDNAFSKTVSTSSGNNHSVATYAPGTSFAGTNRGTTVTATLNTGTEGIIIWNGYNVGAPDIAGYYTAGNLTCKKTLGQNGAESYEYLEKDGKVVCKKVRISSQANSFMTTYYIYSDLGRIVCILTPQGTEAYLASQSASINTSILNGLCYTYKYDKYGQIIEKTVPGKTGRESAVYDAKHRPVLTQTPLMAASGKWAYQVYDSRDRVVFSGFLTNTDTRQAWQDWADGTVTPSGGITTGSLLYYILNGCDENYPTAITGCEINAYNYYDSYIFPTGSPLNSHNWDNSNTGSYSAASNAVAPQPVGLVRGLLTGSRVRVVGNTSLPNQWISTLYYYDRNDRVVQTHTLNPWNTAYWDIATTQYSFSGQVLVNILKHYGPATANKAATTIVKTYYYNNVSGQLMSVSQKLDNAPAHLLASYQYDDLGRVKQKNLGNVEKQNYEYNIRGQLTAINYMHSLGWTLPDQSFGCALSYDYGFATPRYDGAIAGITWRGAGAFSSRRAYGYQYDYAGRMTGADFNEYTDPQSNNSPMGSNPSWNRQHTDYSVSDIGYDFNGNVKTMKQRGVATVAGVPQPVDMDDLVYVYQPNSNTLDRVEDLATNYHLYDFENGNVGTTDYAYDPDGNLTADANKGVSKIEYNEADLPLSVATNANGNIDNTYDAAGTLLTKVINPTYQSSPIVYCYWGPFVYRNDSLLYVLHEEGRCRWVADSTSFRYDYFVKDHLGNIRTIVTADNGQTKTYLATHELSAAGLEGLLFDGQGPVRGLKDGSTNPADLKAAVLNGANPDKRIGTSLLLRVMAGDKFNLSADAYYNPEEDTLEDTHSMGESMLSALLGTMSGGVDGGNYDPNGEWGNGGQSNGDVVNNLLKGDNYLGVYDAVKEGETDPSQPRAYVNYIVFDEDFRVVAEQSGVLQVGAASHGAWANLHLPNDITVGVNGYLAVYLSDEQYRQVSFDNLNITYYRGRLLDEMHYYPHGLVMKGAGASQAPVQNRYFYQGKEMQDEGGLQLYDFHARQYDPQIGRFWGIDPADQFPSGYTGMGNDPGNSIDPSGMQTVVNPGASGGESNFTSSGMSNANIVADDDLGFGWWDDAVNAAGRIEAAGGCGQGTGKSYSQVLTDMVTLHEGAFNLGLSGVFYKYNTVGAMSAGSIYTDPKTGEQFFAPGLRESQANAMWVAFNSDERDYAGDFGRLFGTAGVMYGMGEYGFTRYAPQITSWTQKYIGFEETAASAVNGVGKAFKIGGRGLFWVSAGISAIQGYNAYRKGDYAGVAKSGLDIGMGAVGVWGGPVGLAISAAYFMIDAYYPGGWHSMAKDYTDITEDIISENRKLDPHWQLFPKDY